MANISTDCHEIPGIGPSWAMATNNAIIWTSCCLILIYLQLPFRSPLMLVFKVLILECKDLKFILQGLHSSLESSCNPNTVFFLLIWLSVVVYSMCTASVQNKTCTQYLYCLENIVFYVSLISPHPALFFAPLHPLFSVPDLSDFLPNPELVLPLSSILSTWSVFLFSLQARKSEMRKKETWPSWDHIR